MYNAVFLMQFISAAVILLLLLLKWSNFHYHITRAERASVFYNFIRVFFDVFSGLNILFMMPVIFK